MIKNRREKLQSKFTKWFLAGTTIVLISFATWDSFRESYEPYELREKKEELDIYKARKTLYLEQRPDSTNFDRTLRKEEIDSLRSLTANINRGLSHRFDYYTEGRTYKDYNHHVTSNLEYHIEILNEEVQTMEIWLKGYWLTPSLRDKIHYLVLLPYLLMRLYFYGWEVREAFKEGLEGKSKATEA